MRYGMWSFTSPLPPLPEMGPSLTLFPYLRAHEVRHVVLPQKHDQHRPHHLVCRDSLVSMRGGAGGWGGWGGGGQHRHHHRCAETASYRVEG